MTIDLTANCVTRYKMNEVSGTTVVDSQGFSSGTSINAVTPVAGKINGALSFNGTSDYIDAGNSFKTVLQNSFSLSIWAKINGIDENEYKALFGTYDLTNVPVDYSGIFCAVWIGYVVFEYTAGDGAGTININALCPYTAADMADNWHHIVFVAEKTSETTAELRVYINGTLIDSRSGNSSMATYDNDLTLMLGNENREDHSLRLLDGLLDNVMIFNKALSAAEIAFLWSNGNGTEELTDGVSADELAECWAW